MAASYSLKCTHAKRESYTFAMLMHHIISQFAEILTKTISNRVEKHISVLPTGENHTGRVLL